MGVTLAGHHALTAAVRVTNPEGSSPFIILCDHASNHVPKAFGTLGLEPSDLQRHIAWDPGALPVATEMAKSLDAVLVESCVSRLMIDCNRPLDAPDLICETSETTLVPGNAGLSREQRDERIALSWTPFHAAIEKVVGQRLEAGLPVALVSIHSFNPVYKGKPRPWHVGILHDEDLRIAEPLLAHLRRDSSLVVGDNEPYSPADRVYFTLERHGRSRGLACAMIEIRNDEICDGPGQAAWAGRLVEIFTGLGPEGYGLDMARHREQRAASRSSR